MTNKIRLAAIAAASVLGLTLLSVQQTGALWRAEATLDGGTIQSGRLDLQVGDSNSTTKDYQFDAFGRAYMGGGSYSQQPITIANAGNVLMKYRLAGAAQSDSAVPLTLTVTPVASEADCPAQGAVSGTAVYDGPMEGASFTDWLTAEAGESKVLCLRGTVADDAEPNMSTSVVLSFAAESR